MEAYKYPLISQPNSVYYATCLGLVFYQYEYLLTRERKSEQFNFVSFSYMPLSKSMYVCVKENALKKINKTR